MSCSFRYSSNVVVDGRADILNNYEKENDESNNEEEEKKTKKDRIAIFSFLHTSLCSTFFVLLTFQLNIDRCHTSTNKKIQEKKN
jgi:hypothetical protein